MKARGELVFSGNGSAYGVVIHIGVADGEGGVEFGSESTIYIKPATKYGKEESEYLVQIGGLSSHSAAFARQRAAAYLAAASIADAQEQAIERDGLTLYEAFVNFAKAYRLTLVGDSGTFAAFEEEA